MAETLLAEPTEKRWLRASLKGQVGAVDREKGVISGVILAEEGPFKDLRGEFDRAAIRRVVKLGNDKSGGLKARFAHPTLSDDGLGKFLGRHKNLRSDTVLRETGKGLDGKPIFAERLVARGDLHLDPTSLEEMPGGGKPLGVYVMDLAESDPDALGLSLVLKPQETKRLDKQGRPLLGDDGNELPPLWMPLELHACDCVDEGDATHSFLSADLLAGLPDALVRQGCEMLDAQFAGKDREFVKSHLYAFADRYLLHRFGETDAADEPTEPEGTGLEPELDQWLEEVASGTN